MNEIFERKSVRTFTPEPLGVEVRNHLHAEITQIVTLEACIKFQLIENDPSPFSSFKASYGVFKNASNYIACVIDTSFPNAMQKAGYYAQQIVLYATSLGLGTCFVSGTYDRAKIKAQFRPDWYMPFIIVVGNPSEEKPSMMARLIKSSIAKKFDAKDVLAPTAIPFDEVAVKYPKFIEGLKGVAYAPSAMNRHPVRVEIQEVEGAPVVKAFTEKDSEINQINLGIALYNWEKIVGGCWDFGTPAVWIND